MDVLGFLKLRTKFIRYYYDGAAEPFAETKRKIEEEEAPFDSPPYSEDGEPPYLEELIDADTAQKVLGRTCVSMLSATLKLYFHTWEEELHVKWEDGERDRTFKKGFLRGYMKMLEQLFGLTWGDCPADLELVEQVVLARNMDQHPDSIHRMGVDHPYKDRKRFPNLFFISDHEREWYSAPEMARISWLSPSVHVSREKLFKAIEEVEKLAEWLEAQIAAYRIGKA